MKFHQTDLGPKERRRGGEGGWRVEGWRGKWSGAGPRGCRGRTVKGAHAAHTPSITFRHLPDVGCRTPVLGVCTQPQPLHPATTIPSTLCATHCSSDRVLARQRPGERGFLAEFRPRPLGAGTGWQQAKPALNPSLMT